MTRFSSKKTDGEVDELATARTLLKAVCAWPENQNTLKRILGKLFQVSLLAIQISVTIYFFTEATVGVLEFLQSVTDVFAHFSVLVKDYYIRRNAHQILKIRKILAEDFKETEKFVNVRPVRIPRQRWPWIAPTSLFLMVSSSFVIITITACMGREHRMTLVKMPTMFITNDFIFVPFISIYFVFHYAVSIVYAAVDGLYISFTSVMRDKALTLNKILDSMSQHEVLQLDEEKMTQLVRYHQLIFKLHQIIEKMLSEAVLAQVLLCVVSIAVLLIRVCNVDMPMADLFFALFYFVWVLGQLVSYCVLGDTVTASCLSVSNAAYRAYVPGMRHACAYELRFMLMRAQRPLKITAKRIVTLNKKTFMEIMKRSYSIFSALSQMK